MMPKLCLSLALLLAMTSCASQSRTADVSRGRGLNGIDNGQHDGPLVAPGGAGPARNVRLLLDGFQSDRAMRTVTFVDQFYREPGNEGYEQAQDHILAALRDEGFGEREGLQLEVLETSMPGPAWTPRSAVLALHDGKGELVEVLQHFESPEDLDRTMLPVHAPSAELSGRVVFEVADLRPGDVLVSELSLKRALRLVRDKQPGAVLSSYLPSFNVDKSGEERHLAALRYDNVPRGTQIPVACISQNSARKLRGQRDARVSLRCEVQWDERPLRTIVASIEGTEFPEQCVVLAAHVQEPGAVDNASGVGGQLELAVSLAEMLDRGLMNRPDRSLVFVWGDEMVMSQIYLDHSRRPDNPKDVIAAFSSDMTGASLELTGAMALLERAPDPGAVRPLPPDVHTEWGSTPMDAQELKPSGINIIARCALLDAGLSSNEWETREHPYEGGSDHDVFLAAGIPAVLFWHFTDFAYHTSLDRLEHVDAWELERMSVTLGAAALATCNADPHDLDRYLDTMKLERRMRIFAAREAQDEQLETLWAEWFEGVRTWLRALCLRLPSEAQLPAIEPTAGKQERQEQ